MRIAAAQINSVVGGFENNVEKIAAFANKAASAGAHIVFFPELAISGYPPMDILDQSAFTERNIESLRILEKQLPKGIAIGIGYVGKNPSGFGKPLVNAYGIILDGKLIFEQYKTLLPTYDVFDEARNFEPAREWRCLDFAGEKTGIAVCEDAWRETGNPAVRYGEDPIRRLIDAGASVLAVPSASPYYAGKMAERLNLAANIVKRGSVPLVYINAAGANDSIIFDGRSFILDSKGNIAAQAKSFEEDLIIWDTCNKAADVKNKTVVINKTTVKICPTVPSELDVIEDALVLGIRDYMKKCGFSGAHLGLSGGIDSALTAYLAVRAAGVDNVTAFSMPSMFSSEGSKDDAFCLAKNLSIRYETIPIAGIYNSFMGELKSVFEDRPFNVAEENLQARIRGSLLMAFSNKFNSMLLNTGNKSELAMGYCTLYGDMNGALAPIGDLFKTTVFALCRRINKRAGRCIIPEAVLEKPPSAELRPNQKDQDTLPPYEILDEILQLYLFENLSADEIASRGFDKSLASWIIKTCARAEFKRRQAPPVLKVSVRAFGMGRRMPIARAVYEA